MYKKEVLFPALLFCVMQSFGQSNFTFSPEKPMAGDIITVTYSRAQTNGGETTKDDQSPLKAIVYKLGNKGETANDLDLKKSGNIYTDTIRTDTSDNFVFFSFAVDNKFDNNSNKGYWIQLYDGDSLKSGSDLSLSEFYQFYDNAVGMDRENDGAINALEDEFKVNPKSKKENLVTYARLYNRVHKDEASAMIQKEIESQIKSGLKDEDDYTIIQNLYSVANLPQQSKLIGDFKKEKFPNGQWKIDETIQKFYREKDAPKKEMMLEKIAIKIKNDSEWKYMEPSLTYFQSDLVIAFEKKNDWDGMQKAIKKYDITGTALASIYNNAAWGIQETDKNLDQAEKMSSTAVDIAKKDWKSTTDKRPGYLTMSQWEKSRANTYGLYADTYAMVMYKLGKYKKGFPYTDESAIKIEKGGSADENNTYALLAEKVLSTKKYVKQLEQFVKDGKSTSTIKEILKRAYIKKHKSDSGYDDYMTALEKDSYLKMIADLKKSMLDDAAPDFTLVDLKGNKVNIQELKNKIVIVDFWATWCEPCKASFPGMQKMVTKYKDDSDVKFLFVDTWETTDKKEKNAADFIASKKYGFHVLMDNDSKVVEQFKVSGIPTKFVIDKNGIIRFKAIGFDGSDDKLVSELTAMIDMAKTM